MDVDLILAPEVEKDNSQPDDWHESCPVGLGDLLLKRRVSCDSSSAKLALSLPDPRRVATRQSHSLWHHPHFT